MPTRHIAFYVPRVNALRVFAPVIDYLVRHCADAFHVRILFPGWRTSKVELQPYTADFSRVFGDRVAVERLDSAFAFVRLIRTGALDAVVNLLTQVSDIDPETLTTLRADSRKVGTKWIALPYVFAQSEFVVAHPTVAVDLWDLICVEGPRPMEYIESHLHGIPPNLARTLKERLVITGYPELDGIGQLAEDHVIRQKYGLPLQQPIVFVATAPRFYPRVNSSTLMYGLERRFRGQRDFSLQGLAGYAASLRYRFLPTYRHYLEALRAFADLNGACLVAKTRTKHHDPEYLTEYVDYLFGDTSYFPFTTLELLRVASLYVGFYSSTVIEALAMGVYPISVLFLPVEVAEPLRAYREWFHSFHRGPGGLWNIAGVSEVVDGMAPSCVATLEQFARSRLDGYVVDEPRRIQALDQFVSYRGTSSERFVEVLASCWS